MTDKLYPTDLMLYARIRFFTEDKQSCCYESNASLAAVIGRSACRVSASISKLLRLGYIVNEGSKFARKLKTTAARPPSYIYKTAASVCNSDASDLASLLAELYNSDKGLFAKTLHQFNENANIVKDRIRLEIKKKDNIKSCPSYPNE